MEVASGCGFGLYVDCSNIVMYNYIIDALIIMISYKVSRLYIIPLTGSKTILGLSGGFV